MGVKKTPPAVLGLNLRCEFEPHKKLYICLFHIFYRSFLLALKSCGKQSSKREINYFSKSCLKHAKASNRDTRVVFPVS